MGTFSKHVGLDVHNETIAVSIAEANGGEVRYLGDIARTQEAVDRKRPSWNLCHVQFDCGSQRFFGVPVAFSFFPRETV